MRRELVSNKGKLKAEELKQEGFFLRERRSSCYSLNKA